MSGASLLSMAWRNLWRNRRRTLITLSGFAFGIFLAVIFIGMGDASYSNMIELASRNGGGHVTIQHRDFIEMPSLKKTVRDADALREAALATDTVIAATPRISGPAMLATAKKSYGAYFVAIDPTLESPDTFGLLKSVSAGELFPSARGKGVVLGAKLARNLGVTMGKKVVYTMTDKSGEMASGLARVSGVIETGSDGIDAAMFLLPLDTAREKLGYAPDELGQLNVYLDDQRGSEAAAAALGEALATRGIGGETAGVFTWKQVMPDIAGFIAVDQGGNYFFQMIIMVLIAAGIFNSLFVSVMERLREFGIMLAIGFRPRQIFGLVMCESLLLALVGIVAAALVTIGPYWHFHTQGIDFSSMMGEDGYEVSGIAMEPILYVDIFPEKLLYIALVVIVVTLLAGLYPAWKAGRVTPVEAIKLV